MSSPFPRSSSTPGAGRLVVKLLPQGGSGLESISYQYPLKLITPPSSSPSESESVLVFLLSYGGGLVGGDSTNIDVEILAGAKLSLVTQGHTKIFKSVSPDVVTSQTLNVHIAAGGALCLLPDPVQPFEGSVYEQTQIFRLARGASLCLLDWVTQGRVARGEDWSFVRWAGRNEVWALGDGDVDGDEACKERLLIRDAILLDSDQSHSQLRTLRETMHGNGIFGTLILCGGLTRSLGDFFLAEFAALPRIGGKNFKSEEDEDEDKKELPPLVKWRQARLRMEKEHKVLWSAARVRGCVLVKFSARAVESGRLWIGSMLLQEGSVARNFGDHALMCLR